MSSRIFVSLAIDDVYSISIVQQCRILEAPLATNVDQCLSSPGDTLLITQDNKELLLKRVCFFLSINAYNYCKGCTNSTILM